MSATEGTPRISVASLLDRVFELYFRRPLPLLLIAVPITVVGYTLPVSFSSMDSDWHEWLWCTPLLLILHGLAAMLVTLVVAREMEPPESRPASPLAKAPGAFGRFVLLQIVWLPMLALRFVLLVIPAVTFSISSLFAVNAAAVGPASGWNAVRLSESLVRRRWWHVALLMLMFALPSFLLSWLFDTLGDAGWRHWLEAVLDGVIYPLGLAGQAYLFFDLERMGPAFVATFHPAAARGASGAPTPAEAAEKASADFSAFEHRGWQRAADAYHTSFGRLTSQAAGPLLDAARVELGQHVLDVACGPGYIAGIAASRGALVTGADFSPEMLRMAKEFHPEIEFRVADAEALPFEAATFDAVVMSFLLGHLAHPERAIAEAHRVLKPGGRFAFSWWQTPEHAQAFALMLEAVKAHGRIDVAVPPGPPFDQFSDSGRCALALDHAGFEDVGVVEQPLTWRLATADELFDAYYDGTVRTAGLLREQSAESLAAIRAALIEAVKPYQRDGALEFPMPCWIASGRRAADSPPAPTPGS